MHNNYETKMVYKACGTLMIGLKYHHGLAQIAWNHDGQRWKHEQHESLMVPPLIFVFLGRPSLDCSGQ